MYDCPMTTSKERRIYAIFRKRLIGLGYQMIQQSVYYKHLFNIKTKREEDKKIKRITNKDLNVITIKLTRLQFNDIKILSGENLTKDNASNIIEY